MLSERLAALIEPVVNDLGYEMVLLEFNPFKGGSTLRLFIDAESGIGLEDCERVSREVASVLDVEDIITQAYRLEVSSPGMDRPLVKPEHFRRFEGEAARIQMIAAVNGRKRFQGVIRGVIEDCGSVQISLETPDGDVALPMSDIERARLVPNFDAGIDSGKKR